MLRAHTSSQTLHTRTLLCTLMSQNALNVLDIENKIKVSTILSELLFPTPAHSPLFIHICLAVSVPSFKSWLKLNLNNPTFNQSIEPQAPSYLHPRPGSLKFYRMYIFIAFTLCFCHRHRNLLFCSPVCAQNPEYPAFID